MAKELEDERGKQLEILNQIVEETESLQGRLQTEHGQHEKLRSEWKTLFGTRLNLEREKSKIETTISLCDQLLKETALLETAKGNPSPQISLLMKENSSQFKLLRSENLNELIHGSSEQLSKLNVEIDENQNKAMTAEEETEKVGNQLLESRIKLALLQYRSDNVKEDSERLESQLKSAKANLNEAVMKAEQTGQRIAVIKAVSEVFDEMRITDGHLVALADVSEDIERMYESYSKLYLELKTKAQQVAENREKTLEEVKTRMQNWRTVIQSLLDRVNLEYQKTIVQAQAVGEVKLGNGHDIETAGLEIHVGFKGGKPVPLDAYTQSGGERTTATMSFLLALQQHVRSPFRAVDEYDIHMDPKNREIISKMLISTVKDANAQYIVITPSQITFAKEETNIITVQNVEGKSIIREVA